MRNFNNYYLALSGDINVRWNLTKEFDDEINLLAKDDEELKSVLISNVIWSFDYIAKKVFIYINQKKLKNF
jgi:hypothetical protein